MSNEVSEPLRRLVAERAYHVCEYCLLHEDDMFWGCQIDHIISRKHGGVTEAGNLAWARAYCNGHKGSDIATVVGQPPRLTRLYHPREDRWAAHFQLNACRIEPNDDVGAATERLLQLNHETPLRERNALAQSGRYPRVEALARMKE
jgi:hypothetical protein